MKPGRNDPCPCGSGLKYKKCCGSGASQRAGAARGEPALQAGLLFEQGQYLYRSGRLLESADALSRVLAANPRHAPSLHLLGIIRHQLGDSENALRFLARATSSAPGEPVYRNSYGEVLRLSGRSAEALAQFDKALGLSPSYESAANNKALALLALGRSGEAVALLKGALLDHPSSATLHDNLGYALQTTGSFGQAAEQHRQALEIAPDMVSARVNLGSACQSQGRYSEAKACYAAVPEASEAFPVALHNLGICDQELGDAAQAINHMERALALDQTNADLLGDYVFARHHLSAGYSTELLELSARWAALFETTGGSPPRRPVSGDARITVGYLSPFALASTRYLNESVITRHSSDFQVYFYATSPQAKREQPWSQLPRSCWRDISHLSDEEADRRIRKDKVDILVDLAGNVRGHRLGLLARRPAPLAVTWTESFYTTGSRHVDYFLGDPCSSPADMQAWFTEALVTLPHMRFCYSPPDYAPAVGPPPKRTNGHVTFGCFTHAAKITAQVVEVWARVLDSLSDARLILKWKAYAEASARQRVLDLFAPWGVKADRIEFRSHSAHVEMLAEYNRVDIALDTFPYNGGLTTCEALWMGVPVICLLGDTVVGRQSACMLRAIDCPSTIADSVNAYVERCLQMARNLETMTELRAGLRERMANSALCDAAGFVRDLESVYRSIWSDAQSGQTREMRPTAEAD